MKSMNQDVTTDCPQVRTLHKYRDTTECLCVHDACGDSPEKGILSSYVALGWPVLAFALVIGLTGCASVSEKALHNAYSETAHNTYETTGGGELLDANSGLDDYLKQALVHSPLLRSAFERWEAAMERIPQARSLEDPSLSFEYFTEQRNLRYQAGLAQMFPAFGKVGLRDTRAVAEADAAMHEFEEKRFMLHDRVVRAFYEYHYLHRATEVTDENLRLLAGVENVLATRYKTGLAAFAELIKVQLEKDRLANELTTLQSERGPRSAELVALLNIPAREMLPWPKATPSGKSVIDEAVLAGMIGDLNPELKVADATIAAGEIREKLARKSFLPDFTLGANWMVMPGADGRGNESDVSLMAGITVPLWWGKHNSEIREAEAMERAATNDRDDRRNMLKSDLTMAVFKCRDAERRTDLLTTSLVPKATQALQVAGQEFSSGQTDFMTLIDAQRTLLELRLEAERAMVDREVAITEIGSLVGKYGAVGGDSSMRVEQK